MKKKITITLEVESDDEFMMSNEFIENDLKTEINCASNSYDIVSIVVSDQIENEGTWILIGHNPNYSVFDNSGPRLYECCKCKHVTDVRTKRCPECWANMGNLI